MKRVLRIGTRESALALYQANAVAARLNSADVETVLVPIIAKGDVVLDKPLHRIGTTGLFTKALDDAMLAGEIDLAVHSMKDVPTDLPEGISQVAVLPRGAVEDVLVTRQPREVDFELPLTIATGSLRRKAQWLNAYPKHRFEDLRGNVPTRLQKLRDSTWDGAIFAKAGLARLGLLPHHYRVLDWMLPAPAQGIIMVVAPTDDEFAKEACLKITHHFTEIVAHIERSFMKRLEGGCTAPIGALAEISGDDIFFKGTLVSLDGVKKIDIVRMVPLGDFQDFGVRCADELLDKGGDALVAQLELYF